MRRAVADRLSCFDGREEHFLGRPAGLDDAGRVVSHWNMLLLEMPNSAAE